MSPCVCGARVCEVQCHLCKATCLASFTRMRLAVMSCVQGHLCGASYLQLGCPWHRTATWVCETKDEGVHLCMEGMRCHALPWVRRLLNKASCCMAAHFILSHDFLDENGTK